MSVKFLVAGPGVAPGPPDYEPGEVLFLHPAIFKSQNPYNRGYANKSIRLNQAKA